ncbi:nitroreductase family protein [Anaerosporobacter sp.]|uniref:nitroreductase family protein n=1 Tax=Anaerosporobacter sp. TaxID=1872529 RepID=UPI00286F2C39|nr:nitroreductase family protein [Anaerosporobacter sp.]
MNEVLKVISERFSCRDFNEQIPGQELLEAIAQAGIQAPSGMNRQGWQVIVIKNRDLISDMETEGMKILSLMEDKSMYDRIMSRGGKLFYDAPCMILIAIKEDYHKGAELIDLGIVAQNMAIAATSLGVANLYCGFAGLAFAGSKASEFKEKLKFPEGYECGLGILVGYANTIAVPHLPNPDKVTFIN